MWFLKFLLGFVFIISMCLVLISLMRDLSGGNRNTDEWEGKFRLAAMAVAGVSFGILMAIL